jgi:endo-1,4-beta-xylanase
VETVTTHFNAVVAGNCMKFSYTEPSEDGFTYTNADSIMTLASQNNMKVRGHTLFWHSDYQIPQWVKNKDFSELTAVVENHTENLMTHFKGQIYAWDVFNEVVMDDGSGLRNRTGSDSNYSVWASSSTDDSLIKAAFYKADEVRKANNDDVKLFLCDYSIEEEGGAKADKVFSLVQQWVEEGVPIDGVAFQGHLMEKYTPNYSAIRSNIQRYQALGLEVQFTEVDIRIEKPVTDTKLANQADMYATLLQLAMDEGITTFIIWGVTDKYSWVPDTFPGYDAALIFDDDYNKKPAYTALINVLQ